VATELLRRDFIVDAPIDEAWRTLADVASWPRWAPHIQRVDVSPPGAIGPASTGTLHFRPLGTSRFHVSSHAEGVRWEWVGRVLRLTIRYDHQFFADGAQTRLTWTLAEEGPRRSIIGRAYATFYGRLVDRAIPRLQALLASEAAGG
jgi:carbon monoxide dehydrogenase subunit G